MSISKIIITLFMLLSLWSCSTMDPNRSLIEDTERGWLVSTALERSK